ncbi:hypothetical protein KKC65_02650 [Patescibacteria group bacterium]|nr:hypothetical protein [Patescibacteria group bacterium]
MLNKFHPEVFTKEWNEFLPLIKLFPKELKNKKPNLLTLASMKAFALGGRNKWKDYVDMYFILKDYYKISDIVKEAQKNFGSEFNEKLFRTQLSYFKDINYSEKVIYADGFEVDDKEIRKSLIEFSLEK